MEILFLRIKIFLFMLKINLEQIRETTNFWMAKFF